MTFGICFLLSAALDLMGPFLLSCYYFSFSYLLFTMCLFICLFLLCGNVTFIRVTKKYCIIFAVNFDFGLLTIGFDFYLIHSFYTVGSWRRNLSLTYFLKHSVLFALLRDLYFDSFFPFFGVDFDVF